MSDNSGCGCGLGCFGTIGIIILFSIFIFGISVNGQHYDIGCSCGGVTKEK